MKTLLKRKAVRGRPITPRPKGFVPLRRVSYTAAHYKVTFAIARRWHVEAQQSPGGARYGIPVGVRGGAKAAAIMAQYGVCEKTAYKWLAIVTQPEARP